MKYKFNKCIKRQQSVCLDLTTSQSIRHLLGRISQYREGNCSLGLIHVYKRNWMHKEFRNTHLNRYTFVKITNALKIHWIYIYIHIYIYTLYILWALLFWHLLSCGKYKIQCLLYLLSEYLVWCHGAGPKRLISLNVMMTFIAGYFYSCPVHSYTPTVAYQVVVSQQWLLITDDET